MYIYEDESEIVVIIRLGYLILFFVLKTCGSPLLLRESNSAPSTKTTRATGIVNELFRSLRKLVSKLINSFQLNPHTLPLND